MFSTTSHWPNTPKCTVGYRYTPLEQLKKKNANIPSAEKQGLITAGGNLKCAATLKTGRFSKNWTHSALWGISSRELIFAQKPILKFYSFILNCQKLESAQMPLEG